MLIVAVAGSAEAQPRLNLSVMSPPFWENVNIGRSQYYTNTTKNGLSIGLELDNLFVRGNDQLKLHFSIGAYYGAQSFTGGFRSTGTYVYNNYPFIYNENLASQINTRYISVPIMVRGSVKISELVENNRVGAEFGIVTSSYLRYNLSEAASITYDSAQYYGRYQSSASAQGSLISGFGSKFNVKMVFGLFVYVNRFYISGRIDMISLSNMYSSRLANNWNLGHDYSLYALSHDQGTMKDSFVKIVVSYRITRK